VVTLADLGNREAATSRSKSDDSGVWARRGGQGPRQNLGWLHSSSRTTSLGCGWMFIATTGAPRFLTMRA
jgi:hypothetical protein